MQNIRQKGKISQSEWSAIIGRQRAGETLASIARDYGCTAPAIRYIVRRAGNLPEEGTAPQEKAPGQSQAAARRPAPPTRRMSASARPLGRIDPAIAERVTGDVAALMGAMDVALQHSTAASLFELRAATDRMMRATARMRLELERVLAGASAQQGDEGLASPDGDAPAP